MGLPDTATRASIFAVHLSRMPTEFDPHEPFPTTVDAGTRPSKFAQSQPLSSQSPQSSQSSQSSQSHLQKFADATGGLSGADIEAVCREAAVAALRRDIATRAVAAQDVWQCIRDATKERFTVRAVDK